MYPDVQLYIDGQWRASRDNRTLSVINPATGEALGTVAHAGIADLDEAGGGRAWLCHGVRPRLMIATS